MKHLSAEPRCTNTFLKPDIDVNHLSGLTEKQMARLPRERCGRPMLPVYGTDGLPIASYCGHCDGPLHRHIRGPEVTAAYNERRKTWPWPKGFA